MKLAGGADAIFDFSAPANRLLAARDPDGFALGS
jgi:hypothetical protein